MTLKLMSVQDGVQIAEGHVLVLKNATFDTAGAYQCVIAVPEMQMQTSGLLLVKVRGKELFRLRMFVVLRVCPPGRDPQLCHPQVLQRS